MVQYRRGNGGKPKPYAKKQTTSGKSRPATVQRARDVVVPGITRTTGYYGQFNQGTASELKFHDVDLDDAVITAAGTVTATINIIAQGVTETQRVGRKCTITNINWRYDITMNDTVTADSTSEVVRIILYQDTQCNGAAAAVTDLLESDNYLSFNNLANKTRFRVLLDRTHDMICPSGSGQNAADAFGESITSGSFYKKCSIPLEYDNSASTGAITTIRSNNLGVMLLSKTGNLTTFVSKFRLRFSDGG